MAKAPPWQQYTVLPLVEKTRCRETSTSLDWPAGAASLGPALLLHADTS